MHQYFKKPKQTNKHPKTSTTTKPPRKQNHTHTRKKQTKQTEQTSHQRQTVYNKIEPLEDIACYGKEKIKKATWGRNGSPHGMTLLLTFRHLSTILRWTEWETKTWMTHGWLKALALTQEAWDRELLYQLILGQAW